jgi:Rieske Fe-S protein
MKENTNNERREFIKKAGAVAAFGVFASSFASVINSCEQDQVKPAPAIKDPETVDVDIIKFPALQTNGGSVATTVELKSGEKVSIYIHRIDDTNFSVLDPICKHAGCPVNLPSAPGADMICPCHDVHFSAVTGAVTNSPIGAVNPMKTYKVFKYDAATNILKVIM